jgi:uncharacterized protein YbaA (DUF1428 family)
MQSHSCGISAYIDGFTVVINKTPREAFRAAVAKAKEAE